MQDHASANIAVGGTLVLAIKVQSLTEDWVYVDKSFMFPGARIWSSTMVAMSRSLCFWARLEEGEMDLNEVPTTEEAVFAYIKKRTVETQGWFGKTCAAIQGVSRETTTGVHRLYEFVKQGQLPKPLDGKVARLHWGVIGVKLPKLNKKQSDYIGLTTDGPFKSEYYRY